MRSASLEGAGAPGCGDGWCDGVWLTGQVCQSPPRVPEPPRHDRGHGSIGAMPHPLHASPAGPTPESGPVTLARSDTDGFDIALRVRRVPRDSAGTADHPQFPAEVHELIVNGMFAMDSTDRSSEVALADLAPVDARRVLVGGLGLGFTAERVLQRCPQALVDVVDLSASLVAWAREGITPTLGAVAAHERARLTASDIADVLRGTVLEGPWDGVLLDVDNGPDFLIHDHNARLYGDDLLAAACDRVAPGGVLAVWSERESPLLARRLAELAAGLPAPGRTRTEVVPVDRDGHHVDYALHVLERPAS